MYYSGSHATSIAVQAGNGKLWSTDVVRNRLSVYTPDCVWLGLLLNPWSPYLSPTSFVYAVERHRMGVSEWLLTVSSTERSVVLRLERVSGESEQTESRLLASPLALPEAMYECGLIITPEGQYQSAVYLIDRYRGYVARYNLNDSSNVRWLSEPPATSPTASSYNISATYLAAAAVTNDRIGIIYVIDGVGDRVMRMSAVTGEWMEPLLVELPDSVRGIQAVSWTWYGSVYPDNHGCLWVMYSSGGLSGTERTVIAVSLLDGAVVHNFTTAGADWGEAQRARAGAERAGAGGAALSSGDVRWERQQAGSVAHLASPALLVTGRGRDDDPYQVYMADADPNRPGHYVVVRDESGVLQQSCGSILEPLLLDATYKAMHAFVAVQAEAATCTLWLADVDNGGMLVRVAPDGTILQHFPTPALFTFVVLDSSNASSPSLVLLSANVSGWQLWRFYPDSGSFTRLHTASADPSSDGSVAAVGGLDVDSGSGRLLLSLTSADRVVALSASGEWDARFNVSSGAVVRPGILIAVSALGSIVLVDRSGQQGQWQLKLIEASTGTVQRALPIVPPMVQPLALTLDNNQQRLWVADASGLIFRLFPATLSVIADGTLQPMPTASFMSSLSMDASGTLYAVDSTTRRLILLFVDAEQGVRPSSTECRAYPVPSCESVSGCSSSSSSSSSSTSSFSLSSSGGDVPPSSGGRGGVEPLLFLLVGAGCAAAALVSILSLYRYYRSRMLRSGGEREGVELNEPEWDKGGLGMYHRWHDELDAVPASRPRKADNAPILFVRSDTSSKRATAAGQPFAFAGSGKQEQAIDASDARYDAYVRLYEALSQAQGDERKWHEGAELPPYDSRVPQSSSSSTLSSPSSRRTSVAPVFHSSDDSGSPSTTPLDSEAELSSPPVIARFSSRVVPRFVDEVTDLHILGEGQSGRVYCGVYEGSRVVVKQPKCRSMSAAQWREWQAHLRLPVHPNLVRFIGSLVMEDTNYLVLGWVEQGSLKSLLSAPTATRTARWYTRPYAVMRAAEDIASALQHVHQHGLVHRDVSARNVLVEADGTFVLADLGLCQEMDTPATSSSPTAISTAATTSITAGTTLPFEPSTVPLRWCSPDYLSTRQATGKSDVWALGVTLWECTSGGRLPYEHIQDNTWLQQRLEAGRIQLMVDPHWMQYYEETDERGLVGRMVKLISTCLTVEVERRPTAEQLVGIVQSEMAQWEAEWAEEAERVKRQWADDHAAAPRHAISSPTVVPDEAARL